MINKNFEFLKVKPLPKKQETFSFFINKQVGQPNIIDKTSEKIIDPTEFLNKIQSKLEIQNKTIIKPNITSKKEEPSLVEIPKILTNVKKINIKIVIKQLASINLQPKTDDGQKTRITPKPKVNKSKYETYNFDSIDLEFEIKNTKNKSI
jgi:hypothetical protein